MALGVQGLPDAQAQGVIEEVVVTGSFIRGTPEDAALPVDMISRADLDARGSPNMLDIILAMPYVQGALGGNQSAWGQPGHHWNW